MKDDTISRAAAIDALDEQIRQCDKALSAFDISMKDEYAVKVERASLVAFRETLEYMPSAQPVWIPLAVKYPETNEDVLLQFPSNQGVGFYENGSWGINTGDGIYSAIGDGEEMPMAWMPLPKPWEGR